jgi:hypothetical protein
VAVCLAALASGAAHAAGPGEVSLGAAALPDRELREARGGFVVGGLEIALGIERAA